MAELITLARPYALAAFERAQETGTVAQWSEDLAFFAAILADGRMLRAAGNPKIDKERFTASLLSLGEGRVGAEAQNFLRLLARNRRLGLLRAIGEIFSACQAEAEGYLDVAVTSAYPLRKQDETEIEAVLKKLLNRKPRLTVAVDKNLIGGLYIRAGDRVIDASVRGELERLAKRLLN